MCLLLNRTFGSTSPTTDREIEAGRFFDFGIRNVSTPSAAAVNRKPSIRSRANRAIVPSTSLAGSTMCRVRLAARISSTEKTAGRISFIYAYRPSGMIAPGGRCLVIRIRQKHQIANIFYGRPTSPRDVGCGLQDLYSENAAVARSRCAYIPLSAHDSHLRRNSSQTNGVSRVFTYAPCFLAGRVC